MPRNLARMNAPKEERERGASRGLIDQNVASSIESGNSFLAAAGVHRINVDPRSGWSCRRETCLLICEKQQTAAFEVVRVLQFRDLFVYFGV